MTTLRLKTPPAKLPPLVAEAADRAEAERLAREKAERQERHLRQTRQEIEAGRRRRGERRAADLVLLRQRFPAVFAAPPRPLLLRVSQAIRERLGGEITCLRLGAALHWWTSRDAYLEALAQGGSRHDLDGGVAEAISEEHRQFAATTLERRRRHVAAAVARGQRARWTEPGTPRDARDPDSPPGASEVDPRPFSTTPMEIEQPGSGLEASARQLRLAGEVLREQAEALQGLAGR
ncbi:ProQ/FINO family protein [Roseomonas mucosa]|uniref:ProQ/FINO family protein n=1 Tax=Roseomonas mucosa TaxID=207340 RepID=UPI00142EB968|nr:ProQ/FinO family protein [Roseomonas mucosa]